MKEREIILTQDGSHSVHSHVHGVPYHSKYGALQESRHVFLLNGLYEAMTGRKELAVLEAGLGTGLNAFLTLLEAEKRGWRIYYEALEAYPLDIAEVELLNYPERLDIPERRSAFLDLHTAPWDADQTISPNFTFRKRQLDLESFRSEARFDVCYFDAFAPNAQPELWEEPVIRSMYGALHPGGILVTYCAKGAFKRTARAVGFETESLPGPPGKREMTRCRKPG